MTNNDQHWPTLTNNDQQWHHTTTPPHHQTTTRAMSIALRGATVECKTATGSNFGCKTDIRIWRCSLTAKPIWRQKRPKNSTKQILWLLQQVSHQVLSVPFFSVCGDFRIPYIGNFSRDFLWLRAPWSLFQPVPAKVHLSRGSSCAAARAGVAEWVRSTESGAYL